MFARAARLAPCHVGEFASGSCATTRRRNSRTSARRARSARGSRSPSPPCGATPRRLLEQAALGIVRAAVSTEEKEDNTPMPSNMSTDLVYQENAAMARRLKMIMPDDPRRAVGPVGADLHPVDLHLVPLQVCRIAHYPRCSSSSTGWWCSRTPRTWSSSRGRRSTQRTSSSSSRSSCTSSTCGGGSPSTSSRRCRTSSRRSGSRTRRRSACSLPRLFRLTVLFRR